MLKSMTGIGSSDGVLGSGRLSLEARSVNHRFLDVRVRVPRELSEHGTFLEQLARTRLARGRVEILVRFETAGGAQVVVDKVRAAAALRALAELRDELGVSEPVPLTLLAAVPDLFIASGQHAPDLVRGALSGALDTALAALESMRALEGRNLQTDLQGRLQAVHALVAGIAQHAPEVADRYRQRLRERVARLLDGTDVRCDPGRLEQEVALFADRVDVAEELTRFASHCGQFALLLESTEPVGRKLDFLLQEMAREVNTIGAKASEAGMAFRVVELKAEVERMREQVQNVE
jgi:uncharacterized protein (TIGR00255 family)